MPKLPIELATGLAKGKAGRIKRDAEEANFMRAIRPVAVSECLE